MVRARLRNPDYAILATVVVLVVVGLAVLASASSDLGKLKFDDAYYYLKHQVFYGLSLGILGFLFGYLFDYRKYKKLAPLFLFIGVGALVLTFTPLGFSSGGAARWIQLGPVTVQPSELLKIFFIVYLAAWLASSRADRKRSAAEGFFPFLAISGIIAVLLLLQRSTSAAIILMAGALAVYFVSGARKKFVLSFIGIGLLGLSLIILLTPYRLERIKTYLNSDTAETYQADQALITIGSGKVRGVGYGESTSKRFLPERIGDSIFAIAAEEFGFIGSATLLLLFFTLLARTFLLSRKTRDQFGKLLLIGFGTIIGVQAFVHIGANSGLIPLTGVPLPFISFGGTALVVFMTMSGVILNVSRRV